VKKRIFPLLLLAVTFATFSACGEEDNKGQKLEEMALRQRLQQLQSTAGQTSTVTVSSTVTTTNNTTNTITQVQTVTSPNTQTSVSSTTTNTSVRE